MSWINNDIIEGVLGQPSPLVTNNPEDYGIIFADDIAGHRTVPDLTTLYIIPKAILSKSKNNTNNDAIGQVWFVISENCHYKLIDWDKRHNEEGWEIFPSGVDKVINFGSYYKDTNLSLADKNGLELISSDNKLLTIINDKESNTLLKNIYSLDFNNSESKKLDIIFSDAFDLTYSDEQLIINLNSDISNGSDFNDGYEYFKVISENLDSDIRFKQNIQHINKGILDKLMLIDIISYKWCKQGESIRNTFGVIGKQILELGGLFSKIVHTRNDEDKTIWVEYDRFGVLAIAGIKELERKRKSDKRELLKKIDSQQTIIEELQRDNVLMQKKIKSFEKKINKFETIIKKLG